MKQYYVPKIIKDINIGGLAYGAIGAGETGMVLQKSFILSTESNFQRYCKNLLLFFIDINEMSSLNRILIIIKKNHDAYVYRNFPMGMTIRANKDLKKGQAIFATDVSDISEIHFKDAVFEADIEDEDQIIWLTRTEFRFGLYFDLSKKLDKSILPLELAFHYKQLDYNEMFDFIYKQDNFMKLLSDGWFPFVSLIGGIFNKLIDYYNEDDKYESFVTDLLKEFNEEKINSLTSRWWNNPILLQKREILIAGINQYLVGDKHGYINCVKNLSTEIEGIIRISSLKENGQDLRRNDKIIDYIISKAKEKYPNLGSFGFPDMFKVYLKEVLYENFDLEEGNIPSSRHSVAHGLASFENYSQIKAFQMILLIDQISFYL